MTREELEKMFQYNMTDAFIEWDKAVNAEYKEENEEAFYQGAYAAQKYLIEKACKWLINSFDNLHNEYGRKLEFANQDIFIESFKKAMEE